MSRQVSRLTLSDLRVDVVEALEPLLRKIRYKAAHGGRGGGKSHFMAEQIVLRCFAGKTRVACIREVQATIKDSVRQLIVDKIQKFGLGNFFEVLDGEIRGRNGSLIVFKGMQSYNAENIKSLEDFDIAWVEEAQTLSAKSLRLLRPTIRKDDSEIWFSWNPRYDSDPVDKLFRGAAARKDAIVCEVNWNDNPWLTDVLRAEKDGDYETDPDMADHVWGGGYQNVSEGAYYARLLAAADRDGRIGNYPYNPALPVFTSWDLGVDDYTAIWFFQYDGDWVYVIDYYEASDFGAQEVVAEALPELNPDLQDRVAAQLEIGRKRPFKYQRHFLPHDVANREWGQGAKSRYETLTGLGLKGMHKGAAVNPNERINAVRQLLPMVRFHQSKRVMLGLTRLRRYRKKENSQLGTFMGPLHDENSHGADAFGEFAVNCQIKPKVVEAPKPPEPEAGQIVLPGVPDYDEEASRIVI